MRAQTTRQCAYRMPSRSPRSDDAARGKIHPAFFERNLETVRAYAVMSTWNEVYAAATPDFGRLPVVRKAEDLDAKERAAALRKSALSLLRDALDAFYGDSETVCRDLSRFVRPAFRPVYASTAV